MANRLVAITEKPHCGTSPMPAPNKGANPPRKALPDFSFADERGALTQLCREGWKQINVTSSKAGVFRGGHYHKNNKEAFYIIKGEIEIQLTKDGREETVTVKEGDFFVLKPYAVHSFKFKQDTLMVALYDKGVEEAGGQKDIYAA